MITKKEKIVQQALKKSNYENLNVSQLARKFGTTRKTMSKYVDNFLKSTELSPEEQKNKRIAPGYAGAINKPKKEYKEPKLTKNDKKVVEVLTNIVNDVGIIWTDDFYMGCLMDNLEVPSEYHDKLKIIYGDYEDEVTLPHLYIPDYDLTLLLEVKNPKENSSSTYRKRNALKRDCKENGIGYLLMLFITSFGNIEAFSYEIDIN